MDLRARHCVPCEGGVPKLAPARVGELRAEVPGWDVRDDKLHRTFRFRDFKAAMQFVDRMAEVAEAEGHHPDFAVHYNRVDVTVWTHAIDGLSENDFILAAKIDALMS
jgi:4a-hydroxytetrahydrobiopterin dehydratase